MLTDIKKTCDGNPPPNIPGKPIYAVVVCAGCKLNGSPKPSDLCRVSTARLREGTCGEPVMMKPDQDAVIAPGMADPGSGKRGGMPGPYRVKKGAGGKGGKGKDVIYVPLG